MAFLLPVLWRSPYRPAAGLFHGSGGFFSRASMADLVASGGLAKHAEIGEDPDLRQKQKGDEREHRKNERRSHSAEDVLQIGKRQVAKEKIKGNAAEIIADTMGIGRLAKRSFP